MHLVVGILCSWQEVPTRVTAAHSPNIPTSSDRCPLRLTRHPQSDFFLSDSAPRYSLVSGRFVRTRARISARHTRRLRGTEQAV